jgi:hypothetical protein
LRFAFGCAVKADQAAKHKAIVEKKLLSFRFFNRFGGSAEPVDEPMLP